MPNKTAISWTDYTSNPIIPKEGGWGCTKVSPGCDHCYSETLNKRFGNKRDFHGLWQFILKEEELEKLIQLKGSKRIFMCDMTDLFHPRVPDDFIRRVMEVIADTPQHSYQLLTKRPERMAKWPYRWPANAWAGVSIESTRHINRADLLRQVPAAVRFISAEPLLGPLTGLDIRGIDWLIVGGESGLHLTGPEHPRWMRMEWARELRDMALAEETAYYYKQDSSKKAGQRPWLVEADGSRWTWHQYPGQMTPPECLL